jgi:hypothetical protein
VVDPALAAALAAAASTLAPERVETVWLFPPRRRGARESGVAVLALRSEDPHEAALVICTVHHETEPGPKGQAVWRDRTLEQGRVPPERVDGILEGVLRRLDRPEIPEVRQVAGDRAAWARLLDDLAGVPAPAGVDAINRESLSFGNGTGSADPDGGS